ncbi:MAG: PHP domain-containing protein [Oscillospiraceae bacterium]|nr:PHP domain-containing protein [Oscillospiraceae bacterium]
MGADLHCHSRYSDSSVPVEDVVLMAKLHQVEAIAITDHDTLAGQEEAKHYGAQYGVEIVPGLEISGYDYKRKQKAHILCYYPKRPEALTPICQTIWKNRDTATREMIHLVMAHYPITEEMVERRAKDSVSIYKQHIMHTLIDAGYSRHFFGKVNQSLFSHRNGLAHLDIIYPDVYDVLEAVRAARGVAVMAHPGESREKGLLEELSQAGLLDGVELYCPKNDEAERARVQAIADRYGLVTTGGTDFHGMYSSRCHSVGTFTATTAMLERLKDCASKK